MRKLLAILAVVSLLAALAVVTTASAASTTVTIRDNYFAPKKITVAKNTAVTFNWGTNGKGTGVDHNVSGQKGDSFKSKDKKAGSYQHRFKKTTTVYCTIHPTTMKLTVAVK